MNKIRLTFLPFIMVIFLNNNLLTAQEIWSKIDKESYYLKKKEILKRTSYPNNFNLLSFNSKLFFNKINSEKNPVIKLPNTRGGFSEYILKETPILSPELAKKFPMIKSYTARGLNNPKATAKISVGTDGLHASIFILGEKTSYIEPYSKDRKEYINYLRSELNPKDKNFVCSFDETTKSISSNFKFSKNTNEVKLRTFRIAIPCTGEYSQFHLKRQNIASNASETEQKTAVLSAINTSITRINGVFERDVSVRFEVANDNHKIIFLDPDTDGFASSDDISLISDAKEIVKDSIGESNYDLGHVFSAGVNQGFAQALSCDDPDSKVGGISAKISPVGDAFDVDYVTHEIGHQLGAEHTFNNFCFFARQSASVEPGSGSTIMAYAGTCAPYVQYNSDDYFHTVNITQMLNFISAWTCSVGEESDTGNSPPTADAGNDYSIPKSTPFVLRGTATDTDGISSLTYNWEQNNNEAAVMPPLPTNTVGPMFRSLPPKSSPNRYMPDLATTVAGRTSSKWEVLPEVARDSLNFIFTVRDNNIGGGGTAMDSMKVTVIDADPFTVSDPSSAIWDEGSTQTIIWNKGTTDIVPINCQKVNIKLSIDGGAKFPFTLISDTDNDGTEDVTVPNKVTSQARIMVEAANNIFYNVNPTNFTINPMLSSFTITNTSGVQSACNSGNQSVNYTLNLSFLNGFSESVNLTATGQPQGSNVIFNPTSRNNNGDVTMSISNFNGATSKAYTINVEGNSNNITKNIDVQFNVTSSTFQYLKFNIA